MKTNTQTPDTDKLYDFLSRLFDPNRSAPHRTELDVALPKVAEPEHPTPESRGGYDREDIADPYDYHADWTRHPDPSGNNDVHWTCNYCGVWRDRPPTAPHDHATCRARTRKQPTPTEPVIDEAVYREAARVALGAEIGHWSNGWRTAITAAIRKYEELRGVRLVGHNDTQTRSNACGSSAGSSSSSSASPTGSACSSATSTAAPAADPRRLTQEELIAALCDGPRNVADAQLAKAAKPVTISKKSANEMYRWIESGQCQHEDFYFWLDRNGVEVVPC